MRWMGHVNLIRDIRGNYRGFVRIHEGNEPLEKSKCRWEDININLKKISWEGRRHDLSG